MLTRLTYSYYERRLLRQVSRLPTPKHVGIILDGNRRHAQRVRLTEPRDIYDLGARKLDDVLGWCADLNIPAVTLWVLSPENLRRPALEVSGILSAIEAKMSALARDPEIHRRRVRVRAAGRIDLLPESVRDAIRAAEGATANYEAMILTIAVAYGGREEIADAVRGFLVAHAKQGRSLEEIVAQVTPEAIQRHLYVDDLPDPDLIIRTSGEIRLSGFLLWQSAFSEFYFTDVNWPALRRIDFLRAIRSFQQRQRRYGR
jgi:short-chain Z-isoprenyl diphosphate synthase